jgi:Na+-driven multidrug efflux pump
LILLGYFLLREKYLLLGHLPWLPRLQTWRRILAVGLPAGGEFVISFLLIGITYYSVGRFGAAAQAGTGIGGRIAQALLLPAMAIAFAAGPIAGQNFGAGQAQRVRETFRIAATLGVISTVVLIPLLLWVPNLLVDPFTNDPAVRAISIVFLQITSWGLIAQALIFTCSSLFQGIGHTTPALMAAATRILTFAVPVLWLSTVSTFRIEDLWYVQLGSTALEAIMSVILLNADFRRRLSTGPVITTTVA